MLSAMDMEIVISKMDNVIVTITGMFYLTAQVTYEINLLIIIHTLRSLL